MLQRVRRQPWPSSCRERTRRDSEHVDIAAGRNERAHGSGPVEIEADQALTQGLEHPGSKLPQKCVDCRSSWAPVEGSEVKQRRGHGEPERVSERHEHPEHGEAGPSVIAFRQNSCVWVILCI